MIEDAARDTIVEYMQKHEPVVVLRSDESKHDVCINYLGDVMEMPMVKLSLNYVGDNIKLDEANSLVRAVLSSNIKQDTILWIKSVDTLNVNAATFITDTMQAAASNAKWFVVFSGVKGFTPVIPEHFPTVEWDAVYDERPVTPITNSNTKEGTKYDDKDIVTTLYAPSALNVQVYTNILAAVTEFLGEDPDVIVERVNEKDKTDVKYAELKTKTKVTNLRIKENNSVSFWSSYQLEKQIELIKVIMSAWNVDVQ